MQAPNPVGFVDSAFLAPGYGFHRDELYFLACGARLDWGYADHPPFVPAVAALAHALFGDSVCSRAQPPETRRRAQIRR